MSANIYHPSRGGVRGGRDQFNWEDVKEDKDRENYLGHSVKAPVGRWQKGKDLMWYTRDKVGNESAEERKRKEIESIKGLEAQAMATALGYKVLHKMAPKVDKGEESRDDHLSSQMREQKKKSKRKKEKSKKKKKKQKRKHESNDSDDSHDDYVRTRKARKFDEAHDDYPEHKYADLKRKRKNDNRMNRYDRVKSHQSDIDDCRGYSYREKDKQYKRGHRDSRR